MKIVKLTFTSRDTDCHYPDALFLGRYCYVWDMFKPNFIRFFSGPESVSDWVMVNQK